MSWKGRSAGSISSCSTCDKTHWARQPIFQPPGTFFLQRITKNVWSCLLLSRMMDPSTQHKRKPLGKFIISTTHITPPQDSSLRWEICLSQGGDALVRNGSMFTVASKFICTLVPMNQQRFLKFLQDSLWEELGDIRDQSGLLKLSSGFTDGKAPQRLKKCYFLG